MVENLVEGEVLPERSKRSSLDRFRYSQVRTKSVRSLSLSDHDLASSCVAGSHRLAHADGSRSQPRNVTVELCIRQREVNRDHVTVDKPAPARSALQ